MTWTLIIAVVLGLPAMLASLIGAFLVSPVGGAAGVVLGIAYTVVTVLLLRATPFWPPGVTGWWVIASLSWGASVGMLAAGIAGLPWIDLAIAMNWEDSLASFGGAYPEEIGKGVGVAVILLAFRRLNRPWHGLATGALVGLGFEVIENILYGASLATLHVNSDLLGALQTWGLRLVAGAFMHVIWTAFAGWGLGQALFTAGRSLPWRAGVALGWLGVAFALHFGWNYLGGGEAWALVRVVLISVVMYAVFIWLVIRAWRLARADHSYVATETPLTSLAQLPSRRALPGGSAAAARMSTGTPDSVGSGESEASRRMLP
ncbi:hypothetical protein CGUA_00695 [Corynebacterium guangdongense]|nr:hypothetical protein CGUA_00695 [Corynebacterium guangdongense]